MPARKDRGAQDQQRLDVGPAVHATDRDPQLYPEILSATELEQPRQVLDDLRGRDWGFVEDDTGYLTHDLHTYPAKFIPQIPGHLIGRLSLRGELILDPFGGSGTTALEAMRMGRRALSIDANPVGCLIGQVKTARINSKVLAELGELEVGVRAQLPHDAEQIELLETRYSSYVPAIPHIDKWFAPAPRAELAMIRACINELTIEAARNLADLALSRIIVRVSNQDSETRYTAVPQEFAPGDTVRRFLQSLAGTVAKIDASSHDLGRSAARFLVADIRKLGANLVPGESVDAIITSPPYGNANDYHLYHRFRLFWLGHDPRELARIEIGSHLRHQKENSGVDDYVRDMGASLQAMERVLRSGRYAALVVGDSIYSGKTFDGQSLMARAVAEHTNLEFVGGLERPIHPTRRSFTVAGRRAANESIVLLQKRASPSIRVVLKPPHYRLWPYEERLRVREIEELLGKRPTGKSTEVLQLDCSPSLVPLARRLALSRAYSAGHETPTWQGLLENGTSGNGAARRDPKYATHGLHPYKGKFYPQLAKALMNVCGVEAGSVVLDPFCGSGTTLLEARLNGARGHGVDINPLAAKIARAKTGLLDIDLRTVEDVADLIFARIAGQKFDMDDRSQFATEAMSEIDRWFAAPIIGQINHILKIVRSATSGILQDFLEVAVSSLTREVSHQDPNDLRTRRRKKPLEDADVFGLFKERVEGQVQRLRQFHEIDSWAPSRLYEAHVALGDARSAETFRSLALTPGAVDLVLTSPPYATALPYIDTDRLSLLVLWGMVAGHRRPLEQTLTGSREISTRERTYFDARIRSGDLDEFGLPKSVVTFVRNVYEVNGSTNVGFRRRNLASLLVRFFVDMKAVLANCMELLSSTGEIVLVLGDNFTTLSGEKHLIPTSRFITRIAESLGLTLRGRIPITVTKENLFHMHNAITENQVLRLGTS